MQTAGAATIIPLEPIINTVIVYFKHGTDRRELLVFVNNKPISSSDLAHYE
jgi:hypothetical protein